MSNGQPPYRIGEAMSDVKRYGLTECANGGWVLKTDYDALTARVATLIAEVMHYTSGTPHPDTAGAARYRWLRDGNTNAGGNDMLNHRACEIAEGRCGSTWDAAIDAAMTPPADGEKR